MIVKVYLNTCALFFKLRMMDEQGYILIVRIEKKEDYDFQYSSDS
jgi:hypothetical protein